MIILSIICYIIAIFLPCLQFLEYSKSYPEKYNTIITWRGYHCLLFSLLGILTWQNIAMLANLAYFIGLFSQYKLWPYLGVTFMLISIYQLKEPFQMDLVNIKCYRLTNPMYGMYIWMLSFVILLCYRMTT